MSHRVLNVVWALAACLPVLAQAQQSLGPMSAAQREGSWELSVGAGAVYLDNQLISVVRISDPSAKRVVPGGVLRLGYNLGKMWSLSVGTFAGYAKPATVLQPFGAISWTPNVDRRTSPFLILGGGITRVSWQGSWVASQFGVHVGLGVRQMLSERMALRVEVREQIEKYSDATTFPNSVFNGTATVGLSFFIGGRRAPVANVAVHPATATLASLGATEQLSASTRDAAGRPLAGRVVQWSSSNDSIASVSADGLVTAVADGSATITATSEAASGTANVTVAQAAATLAVAPATTTLTALGQTQQLSVVAQDANNNAIASPRVAWMSSNAAAVTVDASGLATAVRNGTATITAISARGSTATATVTVSQAIASVSVLPPTASISVAGGRVQSTAQAVPAAELPAVNATVVLKNVSFRPNSAALPPEASTDLDAVAQAMQAIPNARWEIGGYTSNMGDAARNQALSRRRALAVRTYLVRRGVRATRLVAVGYGSQNPIASNATVAGRRQNMRVEIKRLR